MAAAAPARAPRSRVARPLSIRRARKTDVPALVALEIAAFRDYYRPHRLRAPDFLAYLARPATLVLVAESRGGVVGYALGAAPVSGHPRVARLDSIAVARADEGRGTGHRLLHRFMRSARARGCRRMSLEVALPNPRARRLFETAGFRPVRTLVGYYDGAVDAVRLHATL